MKRLLHGALAVGTLGVLVWQGITAAGTPNPTAAGLSVSAVIVNTGLIVFREGLEAILLAFFVYAAAMQYNDSDSALWIFAYGSAALSCALYLANRLSMGLGLFVSGICLIGAFYLLMQDIAPGSFWDSTGREMVGIREPGREMVGRGIIASWVGFLTWRVWRKRRSIADAEL